MNLPPQDGRFHLPPQPMMVNPGVLAALRAVAEAARAQVEIVEKALASHMPMPRGWMRCADALREALAELDKVKGDNR